MKATKFQHQQQQQADSQLVNLRGGANSEGSEGEQSPPMSPLRLSQLSSSNSSISSWASSSSQSSEEDENLCNSKEDRSTFNTKFAKFHLDSYRQNDRLRWNFDFDQNRPLEEGHHLLNRRHLPHHLHHHHHSHHDKPARYQWEPAI